MSNFLDNLLSRRFPPFSLRHFRAGSLSLRQHNFSKSFFSSSEFPLEPLRHPDLPGETSTLLTNFLFHFLERFWSKSFLLFLSGVQVCFHVQQMQIRRCKIQVCLGKKTVNSALSFAPSSLENSIKSESLSDAPESDVENVFLFCFHYHSTCASVAQYEMTSQWAWSAVELLQEDEVKSLSIHRSSLRCSSLAAHSLFPFVEAAWTCFFLFLSVNI